MNRKRNLSREVNETSGGFWFDGNVAGGSAIRRQWVGLRGGPEVEKRGETGTIWALALKYRYVASQLLPPALFWMPRLYPGRQGFPAMRAA